MPADDPIATGRLVPRWLGVSYATNLRSFGTHGLGAVVTAVAAGSPAESAGLHPGDGIVWCNGMELRTSQDIWTHVQSTLIGRPLGLSVVRGGQLLHLQAIVAPEPSAPQTMEQAPPDSPRGRYEAALMQASSILRSSVPDTFAQAGREAASMMQPLLRDRPLDRRGYFVLGQALAFAGDIEGAIAVYRTGQTLATSLQDADSAAVLGSAADVLQVVQRLIAESQARTREAERATLEAQRSTGYTRNPEYCGQALIYDSWCAENGYSMPHLLPEPGATSRTSLADVAIEALQQWRATTSASSASTASPALSGSPATASTTPSPQSPSPPTAIPAACQCRGRCEAARTPCYNDCHRQYPSNGSVPNDPTYRAQELCILQCQERQGQCLSSCGPCATTAGAAR